MSPADATDAASGPRPEGGPADPQVALERIGDALGRIAAALARRAERDAERRDHEALAAAVPTASVPDAAIGELRDRLDMLILRLRAAIDEAEA